MDATAFATGALEHGGLSDPIPFVVLLGADRRTFIRVLAQFDDTVPLGGTPPTVLITAGLGRKAAEVTVSDDAVPIIGSDGSTVVATATCARTPEDHDTYLVVIDHDKDSGPWSFVIRNEESNPLSFFGLHSDDEARTLRPWMQVGAVDEDGVLLGGRGRTTSEIRVRNVGPVPLELHGSAGDTFGAAPATIAQLPAAPIRPHRTAIIVVTHPPMDEVESKTSRKLSHTFASNDPDVSHGRINFTVAPPVLPPTRCRKNDGCREFRQRFGDEGACDTCSHDQGFHGLPFTPVPHP